VFVVFYSSYRHHSKCAAIDRCGVREAARITAYEAKKVETMMVSQSMQEGTKTRHERDVLAAQLVELEKKYRRSEGQASC
jgi:ribosomal protein L14